MLHANIEDPDQATHQKGLVRAFSDRPNILHYPLILQAGDESPDQTARYAQSDQGLR